MAVIVFLIDIYFQVQQESPFYLNLNSAKLRLRSNNLASRWSCDSFSMWILSWL